MNKKSLMCQPSNQVSKNEIRELLKGFLEEGEEDSFEWESITTKNGLSHNWIYDLFQDSTGRIWVGTWGGGACMLENGKWHTFQSRDGLLSSAATCIREDCHGEIWVATDSGLNRFDGKRFIEAGLHGKSLLNITFDRKGNLWAGCWRSHLTGGGVFKYDGSRWVAFSTSTGLPGLEILKIFEDSRGYIWIGTYERGAGAGVSYYDGAKWNSFNRSNGLINDCVYSMFEDPEENMWFGTVGGISIYDRKQWHRITSMDGLVDDRVYCMIIDSKKKMWFGTEGGVSRFDGADWKSFTKQDGLSENLVRTILEDRDGHLWFGNYPYEPGKGGISIARRKQDSLKLEDRLSKYLPSQFSQKALPKKE